MSDSKKEIKVLHLSNDYLGSSVYRELYGALSYKNIDQIVFSPRRNSLSAIADSVRIKHYDVRYSNPIKSYHRFFFGAKANFLYAELTNHIRNVSIDVVHATTWYSDGVLAHRLFKEYNIPYLITVRNTDLNIFFRYMRHLRPLGFEILRNASKIVFVSAVYARRFVKSLRKYRLMSDIESKIDVIPNGINKFWVENQYDKRREVDQPIKLLYIGNFTRNKNVVRLIQAVKSLNVFAKRFELHLVGNGGSDLRKVKNAADEFPDSVLYHGPVYDHAELMKIMRSCDIFTMPSKHETFGLVYLEALSQGLPIIYTRGEGIDGFYSRSIGEAVDALSITSIASAIVKISDNYSTYKFDVTEIISNHDWNRIADKYCNIYKKIIES